MRPKNNLSILLSAIVLLSFLTLGCGTIGKVKELAGTAQEIKETVQATDLEVPGSEKDGDPSSPTATPEGNAPKAKDPSSSGDPGVDAVNSFRRRDVQRTKNEDGTDASVMITEIEWTRDPPALRSVISSGTGEIQLELITVGDTSWMRSAGGTWIELEGDDISVPMLPELPNLDTMTLQGTEQVNGVSCKHYGNPALGYEIWIADQKGTPTIALRVKTQMGPVENVVEISDVNEPLTIAAPETD